MDDLKNMTITETAIGYSTEYPIAKLVDHTKSCPVGAMTFINLSVMFSVGDQHSCSLIIQDNKLDFFNPHGNTDTIATNKITEFIRKMIPIPLVENPFNVAGAAGPQTLIGDLIGDFIDNGICGLYVTIYVKNLSQGRSQDQIYKKFAHDIQTSPIEFYKDMILFAIRQMREISSGDSNVFDLALLKYREHIRFTDVLNRVQLVNEETARETSLLLLDFEPNSIFNSEEIVKMILKKEYTVSAMTAKLAIMKCKLVFVDYIEKILED